MKLKGIRKAVSEYKAAWSGYGPGIYLNRDTGELFMANAGGKDMWLDFHDKAIWRICFDNVQRERGCSITEAVRICAENELANWGKEATDDE